MQLQLATVSRVNGDSGIWSILNWSVVGPIASGVYGVDASMRVEYTEMVLTTEHPLQHLDIPEITFYAMLCLALVIFFLCPLGITLKEFCRQYA